MQFILATHPNRQLIQEFAKTNDLLTAVEDKILIPSTIHETTIRRLQCEFNGFVAGWEAVKRLVRQFQPSNEKLAA